jgi:hypothetical protein
MKRLLALFSLLLLTGCAGWPQFSDALFGPDTDNLVRWCSDSGECTEVKITGSQTDMALLINILAQRYGVEIVAVEE